MAWKTVERTDTYQGTDKPFISVSHYHFSFNAMFTRMADLSPEKRVLIHLDEEKRKIGFEFITENRKNSFPLWCASSDKKGKKRNALTCTNYVKKHPWIKSITKLNHPIDRRFKPKREGPYWVIQLCPAFEEKWARESNNIPSEAVGIYRYHRENGEVVYIGRGNIRKRLNSEERKDWDFDKIEYSIIKNPDDQIKWETYWLERYKESNKGELPRYNKI